MTALPTADKRRKRARDPVRWSGRLAVWPRAPDVLGTSSRRVSAELEKNVRSDACVLRQFDTPPDRALLLVKEAIAFEIPVHNLGTRHLLDEVALWCIDAYYAA